ncbi:hypothetical protein [Bacteroides thetaiotaomicron]|uniref:hypothetical protein n=1 Tax=Bacteroides thetaiotaomicron TaxID=818 RepID=UPI002165FBB8|nr:hypothetical protein [Bacteroides thetaiotaomicron]UVV80499.1 hypothetical protein NXX00_24850 [Bacteroides thetaiotaomicron]
MKRTIVQIIFFIYCIANVYPQYSTIWQLGKTDNSSKEFALAPDGKDRFIISGFGDNKKYFYAGEHTPADFPYIIPGGLLLNGLAHLTGQDNAGYNFLF